MKISQVELGRKIGLTQPQIARLENLDVIPTFTTLGKYAAGLGFNLKLTVVPA
ncbi:helix-turn-helix transcriptional regulator, partial [Lactobacillus crispatus]